MTKAMKNDALKVLQGAAALAALQKADAFKKSVRSTTADLAEGEIKLPAKNKRAAELKIISVPYTGRDGRQREYPAVRLTDSSGAEHDVALSAFLEKPEVKTADDRIILRPNLAEFDTLPTQIFDILCKVKTLTIYRVKGYVNNRLGRFEWFTAEY